MPNWYKIITPHIIYPGKVIYRTTFKICTFLIHFSTRRCSWQVQYSWWFPLPWNVTLQCFILFQGQTNSWKYPFNKIYLIHVWVFSTLGFRYPELCSLTILASRSDYLSTFSLSSSSRFSSTFSSSSSRELSGLGGRQVKKIWFYLRGMLHQVRLQVNLAINQIRLDYIYLLINSWVRWGEIILKHFRLVSMIY